MPTPGKNGHFGIGKIPPAKLLKNIYPYLGRRSNQVLIGPGIGRDAAAVKYDNAVLVFHTDPITGTTSRIGEHSVHINANDIATTGARPAWYMCTILLPPNSKARYLRGLMQEIHTATKGLGVAVIGGHTEVTPGLARPVIVGFMVGETSKRRVLSSQGGVQGDRVLLTKTAGLEGTAILATDYARNLNGLQPELLARARGFSKQISIVKEALAVARIKGVHALHDPTEGGVLNGLWELSEASHLGIEVWANKIPVAPETRRICTALRLDPLRLMSSGSLLITVQPSRAVAAARVLRGMQVRVSEVGGLTPHANGRWIVTRGQRRKLAAVPRDELYKLA